MDLDVLWNRILSEIKNELNSLSYSTWFEDTKLDRIENNKVFIIVSMPIQMNHLKDTYSDLIKKIFRSIDGKDYELEFLLEDEEIEKEEKKIIRKDKKMEKEVIHSNLRPNYTFDSFVVGSSNKFAHAAALAVAEQPGALYNPLFIYGNSGLGKTHLMQAIGNYIVQNSNNKVLYVTSEQFKDDYVNIIKKDDNGTNLSYIDYFKDKYRSIDVLIIDDIQFLAGSSKTQHEFFNTFNDLFNNSKQIIISSDRSPDDLKLLEERLRTRFSWGLTVNIYPPDIELKKRIIKNKMTGHAVAKLVDEEVIDYIASNSENDVRHIEGAVTRLYAYAAIMGPHKIDLQFANEALKDYIKNSIYMDSNISKIQKAVADYYNITVEDLKSKKRSANINYPRQVAIYLCRNYTDESFPKIGLEFGNRNHSTIIHACDKIKEDLKENQTLREIIKQIKNNIS